MNTERASHYDPSEGGRYWYRKVKQESVAAETVLISNNALNFFASDLGLSQPYPEIQWMRPEVPRTAKDEISRATRRQSEGQAFECEVFEEADDITGCTPFRQSKSIRIRVGLDRVQLVKTIADEMRHIWQERHYGEGYREDHLGEAQADAENYATDATPKYLQDNRAVRSR